MHAALFLTILPALLGTLAPSLALPIPSSNTLSVDARALDLSPDTTPLIFRNINTEFVVERDYVNDEFNILSARVIDEEFFPRANRLKRTAAEAQRRKAAVKAMVATNQANNAAKKIQLQAKAANELAYGKPRKPKYTVITTKDGRQQNTNGYRKQGRDAGRRLPKQPKTPKPNFVKGEHKTNAKAVQKQAEARARLQAKKAAGRNAHAAARNQYALTLAHGNMPNRHDEYHVPNHGVLHGKDVRTGAYNLGMHDGNGGRYPVTFRNDLQGPANNRHQPLPHMVGTGREYPLNNGRNGYHPHHEDQGPVRGIYQNNPAGGYNVQGVIAHDVTLDSTHPGYNDHHQIHATPAPT